MVDFVHQSANRQAILVSMALQKRQGKEHLSLVPGVIMKMQSALVEMLVEEHYENLYRFALSLTRNETEAADLTQQTFLHLAVKGGQIREQSKAKSWLFTTLRREFYALRKQTDRFTSIDDKAHGEMEAPENVELDVIQKANAALLMEGLQQLQEVYRIPLALFYFEDFSYREIARILNVPEGTVMSRLSRGKSELRTWLFRKFTPDSLREEPIPSPRASGK